MSLVIDPAARREAAELSARCGHAMARHHDRPRVLAERCADLLRQQLVAQLQRDLAIGQRLAGRDGAGDGVDLRVEFRDARDVELCASSRSGFSPRSNA